MKSLVAAILLLVPAAAFAASGPQSLGTFGDWIAASYGAGPAKACYAFTRAKTSSVELPMRGSVLLTVTQRKSAADEVTISAGYTYPKSPSVTLTVGTTVIDFYTSGQTAFTSSGANAITAFQAGATAMAKSTNPRGKGAAIVDNFSLTGFSDAYKAIKKACP